jgi:hypothetical protein
LTARIFTHQINDGFDCGVSGEIRKEEFAAISKVIGERWIDALKREVNRSSCLHEEISINGGKRQK